jgi:hypothetical protein
MQVEAGGDPFLTNNDGRKPSDLTSNESIRVFLLEEEAQIIRNKAKIAKREQAAADELTSGRKLIARKALKSPRAQSKMAIASAKNAPDKVPRSLRSKPELSLSKSGGLAPKYSKESLTGTTKNSKESVLSDKVILKPFMSATPRKV